MRYAVLVDGSFMLYRLGARFGPGRFPEAADVVAECEALQRHELLRGSELLRILFYDARPYAEKVHDLQAGVEHPLDRTETFRRRRSLLSQLELAPNFALRLGELSYESFTLDRARAARLLKEGREPRRDDLRLRLSQKGVDLRIGLDIARFAFRDRVDALVVVTGDSDFISAFKFARREGVRVSWT